MDSKTCIACGCKFQYSLISTYLGDVLRDGIDPCKFTQLAVSRQTCFLVLPRPISTCWTDSRGAFGRLGPSEVVGSSA
eukprot:4978580-Amphidinium_carterae.1